MAKRKYRKKTPKQKAKEKLMLLVKAFVYERDNYTCRRCERQVYGKNCHASHIIPVSADGRLAFHDKNMKVLCYKCHVWWHENPCESGMWYRSTHSDMWRYLQSCKRENATKGTIPLVWFEELIEHYEGLAKEARRL